MQIYYTEGDQNTYLVDRKRDYVPAQTLPMETTTPTSGSCSGRRQLPAPNNGASWFPHTYGVDDELRALDPAEQRKWKRGSNSTAEC